MAAARMRYMGQMAWEAIADELGISSMTLRTYREKPLWAEAVAAVVEEMKREGVPEAWAALVRCARSDDISAAREILNRIEGAVKQTVETRGPGPGGEHVVKVDVDLDELCNDPVLAGHLADLAAAYANRTGNADGFGDSSDG